MSFFGRSQSEPGPRTAEDRERARREREARRAAREGRPLPPPVDADDGTGNVDVPEPAADAAPADSPGHEVFAAQDGAPTEHVAPPVSAEDLAATAAREDVPAVDARDDLRVTARRDERSPAESDHTDDRGDAPDDVAAAAASAHETPDDDVAAVPLAEESGRSAANGGDVRKPMDAPVEDSWFDEPAPAAPPAEPVAADAVQPTVEWDVLRDAPKEPVTASRSANGGGPTVEFDTERHLRHLRGDGDGDDVEPRVTRVGRPVGARRATAASADEPRPAAPPRAPVPAPAPPAARRARYGDEDERPVAPKRVPHAARTLPPPPPPPGERRRGSGRRGRRIAVVVVLLALVAGGAWLYSALYQPFAGEGGDRVAVEIPPEATASDIGALLEERGVVASSTFFALRSRFDGSSLKAGKYTLREDMSYADAIAALSAGPAPARTINVTIPEGLSRRELRPVVNEAGLRGSYLEASERSRGFRPSRYGAPRDVPSLEGFLFPATYELRPNATSRQLVRKQLEAFEENIDKVSMRRARARNLDVYDVLIIASMVEREATLARERPIIAAVIHNRLRQGMPLGIDATIRFATRNWTRPLRVSELDIDSPYNTRTRTGLPPGPIGSPGLDSIKAAANPANVDYLFYVVKPNGDGAHNFSSTDAEFQRDVAAYNRERERRGGQDPSSSDGG